MATDWIKEQERIELDHPRDEVRLPGDGRVIDPNTGERLYPCQARERWADQWANSPAPTRHIHMAD